MTGRIHWGGGSKYHAQPRMLDGHRFASGREATRYLALKLAAGAGVIRDLELQPRYPLHVGGVRVAHYVADFRYFEGGQLVVEDSKGVRTSIYQLKKKMLAAEYGIEVRET